MAVTRDRFVIFGCGGFGRELVSPARRMLAAEGRSSPLVFASDNDLSQVIGVDHVSADSLTCDDRYVIAVADGATRRRLSAAIAARPGTLVAPTAIVGPDAHFGEGAVICDFVTLTASCRIGRHFQCNIYSYVAHDCVIGDFVTFAPRVCCNGNVHIGDGAYIGTGAVLKQGTPDEPLMIGENAVIGMGAVVTKSVPDGAVVVGNPARLLAKG